MASSMDPQGSNRKREVSYFGPIYISAYPHVTETRHESIDVRKEVHVASSTSEKGTCTEPLDISKYRISKDTDKKTQNKPASPKRSPKRFLKQMKLGIGGRLHRHSHQDHQDARSDIKIVVEPKDDSKHPIEDKALPAKDRRLDDQGCCSDSSQHVLKKTNREACACSLEAVTGGEDPHRDPETSDYQYADLVDDSYETVSEKTFKISSTEDNYLKNKTLLNEQSTQFRSTNESGSLDIGNSGCIHATEVGNNGNPSSFGQFSNANALKDNELGRERVFKHREVIAKLKRKFFESPPKGNKPLPIKTNTSSTTEHNQEGTQQFDKDHIKGATATPTSCSTNDTSDVKDTKERGRKHFATESRASRLRHSGKSTLGRQRRHSLDGKLFRTEDMDDHDMDWLTQNTTRSSEYVAVVAIDFGTSQSGYAYSFLHDPGTIYTMRRHDGGDPGVYNQKIPTTILLTPDGDFHSFGLAAIDYYHDLDPKESAKWLFFDKFKMMLFHEKKLGKDCMLKSVSGREISAMEIFARSLCYFKGLVIEELSDQSDFRISSDVIRWVITVPAIWRASAKQFMREAAYDAGLVHPSRPDQLLIALEPEAASIYCRKLRLLQVLESPSRASQTDKSRASTLSLPELCYRESSHISNDLSVGTRYLVVDCGGGTVDITVHEILPHGRLKELHRASGGAHGSTGVDEEFERLLCGIFGEDIILHFKRKRPSGWVEVMSMFESRKRVAGPYRSSHISISLPFSFIDFYKKCRGHSVDNAVKKYNDPDVTWTGNGMLKLTPAAMRCLFLPTIDGMKQAIGSVLNSPNTRGLSYMFLVGGFAESSMVQHEIRKDFGELLKIIIPPGVGMTIVKGAVYFGLDPNVVSERRSCQTYGVGVLHRFDPLIHPKDKMISKDGVDWCTDIFDAFVHVNQSVALGERIVRRYTPVRRNQSTTTIHIYSTDREHVLFISDDDVTRCGTLSLSLDDAEEPSDSGTRREIRAEMTFGDTEIKVRATDVSSGRCVEAFIDFING